MAQEKNIPFIRILNSSDHQGDELWVIAGMVRLLNVFRVWVYEVETRMSRYKTENDYKQEDLELFSHSSQALGTLLQKSYVVLTTDDPRKQLAFLEQKLFEFETLYITSDLCLIISEERVEFHADRYDFLKHNLHGVLHDLRQPLTALHGFTEMVKDPEKAKTIDFQLDTQDILQQCKSQLERAFELIKGSFAIEHLDVHTLENIAGSTFNALLKTENIEYRVENSLVEGRVLYSKMWFQGLLSNVIDNAKKSFWFKGEQLGHGDFERRILLEFTEGVLSTGEKAFVLRFADTGLGFSADVIEDGFASGESDWEGVGKAGQGVGMAEHVAFIQKLRGEIELRNINDHGHIDGAEILIKLPWG